MRKIFVSIMILVLFGVQAESGQILIHAEFLRVPKSVLDKLARSNPSQLPSAELLLELKESGKATVLYSPTILTQPGTEASFKAVQEIMYPTYLNFEAISITNANDETIVSTAITPSDLETREVGVILSVLPEIRRDEEIIHMTFSAEIVDPPVWKQYSAAYKDALSGKQKNTSLEQPFFYSRSVTTMVYLKNGATVLASGGMNDINNRTVVFLTMQAQYVNSEAKLIGMYADLKKPPDPYLVHRKLEYRDQLHKLISGADKIIVRAGGDICCVSAEETLSQEIYFEVTDTNEIAQVYQNLKFETKLHENNCLCCGHPGIDWYKGTNRVLLTSVKHGYGLMSQGTIATFKPESRKWMENWLLKHGMAEKQIR